VQKAPSAFAEIDPWSTLPGTPGCLSEELSMWQLELEFGFPQKLSTTGRGRISEPVQPDTAWEFQLSHPIRNKI
jgi:hypothetical protein